MHRWRSDEIKTANQAESKTINSSKPSESQTSGSAAKNLSSAQARARQWQVAAGRETVEALVIAFIMMLLFRAFLAEVFVIPTGSMAPTLMGAHKDLFCDACGYNFRVGASLENGQTANRDGASVVGGICPNCRRVNALDLAGDGNHATFNGDRIVVNKMSYVLGQPSRWDVIVFKYPGNPKQNYIKRLVGLPGETLTIRHGDVYAHPTGTDQQSQILRKPESTMMAMSQLVHDTDFQPRSLVAHGFPSRWQPWEVGADSPPDNSWKISRQNGRFQATLGKNATATPKSKRWLRYFHNFATDQHWDAAESASDGQADALAAVDPYRSAAITDFYGYNGYINVSTRSIYARKPVGLRQKLLGETSGATFNPNYRSGAGVEQFDPPASWGGQDQGNLQIGREGTNWVGDLILQTEIETQPDATAITLELVEAGIQYQCVLDLASGQATLSILGEEGLQFDTAGNGGGNNRPGENAAAATRSPTAATPIRAGSRHRILFSNCDDQLRLRVDGQWITFDSPTTFDSRLFRPPAENYPRFTDRHPLDASPAAIAVTGGQATIDSLKLRRDKYYIAANQNDRGSICDYDMGLYRLVTSYLGGIKQIQNTLASPQSWQDARIWNLRREVTFPLQEDQYFPMGDNSPESLDARCWAGVKRRIRMPGDVNRDAWRWGDESYVPRDLLIGRAVVVFWPHSWNAPVPFLPNFKRMKLIR